MSKESSVYNGITYTLDDVWEAPKSESGITYGWITHGTVIGFTSSGCPVVEDIRGRVHRLDNTLWTKRQR